ncbi:MAG: DUF5916 domain-containing protein [Janthinobacterium lividum]
MSTPPTQQPGPGSPGGDPTFDAASESIIAPPPVPPSVWTRSTFQLAPCTVAPRIDGHLDDACWKSAMHVRGFYRYGGGKPSAQQTEIWICADRTHLYVAFHCLDSQPNLIQSSMTQRNGNLGRDDFVGFDIDSQGSRHGYSTFITTARGTQFELLEGGTADNITWAGDWKAATQRTKNGWTCEMAIPFALMRYPRGATSFGIVFYRLIGRETSLQSWPYMPPAGVDNATEPQFLNSFAGIAPPFYAPRPTFLPYTLVTGGTGNSARTGLDIKYPLSTTLTGVGTLYPDFQTIEQDVTNINFSYNEKLLTDRRPFFAEGSSFLPDQDMFYSRRVGTVDGGLKVVGKQGATTIGLLTTASSGNDAQSAAVLNLQQDIGLYSYVRANFVDSIQSGAPSSQAARLDALYGWQSGQTRYALEAQHSPSWQGGQAEGAKDYVQFTNRPVYGKLRYTLSYEDTAPNFDNQLGYNPELNRRGEALRLSQYNQFDKGIVENYSFGATIDSYDHHTGGFFHSDLTPYANISTRNGLYYELDFGLGRRDQLGEDGVSVDHFHDHTLTPNFGWAQKTLYQQGLISDTFGQVAGQSYNLLSLSQGILVSRPFSVQLNYSRQVQGSALSTQAIATGTYRLNDTQTIGGRIVNQGGVDQGTGLGTDVYFSFSQQVRTGLDVFLLFGDPNSPVTRGKFTLKIIHPF